MLPNTAWRIALRLSHVLWRVRGISRARRTLLVGRPSSPFAPQPVHGADRTCSGDIKKLSRPAITSEGIFTKDIAGEDDSTSKARMPPYQDHDYKHSHDPRVIRTLNTRAQHESHTSQQLATRPRDKKQVVDSGDREIAPILDAEKHETAYIGENDTHAPIKRTTYDGAMEPLQDEHSTRDAGQGWA